MAKVEKMNVVLAKVDHSASVYAKEVNEYAQYFKNAQGAFRGEKKTYIPREGYPDDPTKKGVTEFRQLYQNSLIGLRILQQIILMRYSLLRLQTLWVLVRLSLLQMVIHSVS